MWLVPLALSLADAQTLELTANDMGTTVPLLTAGLSYTVDLTSPKLDLDQVNLATPGGETTLGQLYDEVVASSAEVDDILVLSLGDQGDVWVSFIEVERSPGRSCRPLYERRCVWMWGQLYCQLVEIGLTCCPSGGTDCGDYILSPE